MPAGPGQSADLASLVAQSMQECVCLHFNFLLLLVDERLLTEVEGGVQLPQDSWRQFARRLPRIGG